jgi:ABC-2 type transport system ATP-binding protein
VEQICSHIGVMHAGRLVAQGPVAELRADGQAQVRVDTDQPEDAARVLRELGVSHVAAQRARAVGRLGSVPPEKVVPALVHAGVPVLGFAVESRSLEELFVSLTGEGFDVNG